ncbi:MAG: hypothetical protein J0L69_13795 [Bacteroidetes bacterium]|nr:hypothetical protein [Bacteroidota bacterium]
MPKNILIPIDFCVTSLNTVKIALEENKDQPVRIVLLYAEFLNDSITDLLFYSPQKIIKSKQSPEFKEALEILRNRYGLKPSDFIIELLHHNNSSQLNFILQSNNITAVYIPSEYKLKTLKHAFNPIPLLQSLNIYLHKASWNLNTNSNEQEQLTSLFN